MARVKGSAIGARVRYVRDIHGEDAWERVQRALSPSSRAELERGVLPSDWASYELFLDLNVTADRLLGKGDLELCLEMGRFGATVNLPTLYRVFLRFGSPMFLLQKASRLWQVNYDSGLLVAIREAKERARLRIEAFERPHRAHCLSVLGWSTRAIELTGFRVVSAQEEKCRTRGDATCEMVLEWK